MAEPSVTREDVARELYISHCAEQDEHRQLAADAWERVKNDLSYPFVRQTWRQADAVMALYADRLATLNSPERRIDALARILERLPANPARSLPAVEPLSGIDLLLMARAIDAEIITPLLMAEREDYTRMQRDRDEAIATLERERDALRAVANAANDIVWDEDGEFHYCDARDAHRLMDALNALTPADPTGGHDGKA